MKFDDRYFSKFNFTEEQIDKNFKNALKDLNIAKKDKILDVKLVMLYCPHQGGYCLIKCLSSKNKKHARSPF